ncbi:heavy metal-responsive transcriptional regulator [candidate division KSB3 bacterium]|uniref:Mercuric resistance operon regulatory protein n=1 Tax=candidate division KSB3 bacterium TaxID=2044937 RepID=A0A2G6KI86_9BACT|nr:MAG: heavy metal-responsive transcriptional regulator [candidate division KSB3 bacterium]
MEHLTTGQLAKQARVNIETVRYYERRGLIPEPPRRESGYRKYPINMVERIQFIKRAQELGFSLKEIGELLSLRLDPHTPAMAVRRKTEAKVKEIEQKIDDLQQMKHALVHLIGQCDGHGTVDDCPIIEALEKSSSWNYRH